MATVHSLVCWGGRTGKTVTMTIASPCVVTFTNHGLRDGTGLVFSTTGALPTGITAGTTYYAKITAANTFNLYADSALTSIVNTSGTQSGTHTAKSKLMLDYFDQYPGRWGDSGSERCYDGLISWHAARTSLTTALTVEVCEIGQAFSEPLTGSTAVIVNMGAAAVQIASRINGVRTEAWHGGNVSSTIGAEYGYVLKSVSQNAGVTYLALTLPNSFADGFTILRTNTSAWSGNGILIGFNGEVRNILAVSAYASGTGFSGSSTGAGCRFVNCLAIGFGTGYSGAQYVERIGFYNCVAIKNLTGFGGPTTSYLAVVINCAALGNTTANWGTTAGLRFATNNLGGTGEAWITTGMTRIEVTEASPFSATFTDFTNNNVRPYSISSAQVDSGVEYYGALFFDIDDDERPNYNNGGSEAFDVGCYEFDHGYGPHPITASLTLTGLASGTDVVVREAGTSTILDSVDSVTGSWAYTYGSAHNVDIDVIKPGMVIVTFRNLALTATSTSLPVSQQFDRNYS